MARKTLTYAEAGVDIDAGDQMVDRISHLMKRTYGPRVMGRHGGFAGLFRLDYNEKLFKRNFRDPVLVSCADGVGTKVLLAIRMGVHDTVGRDCVAMNVNDMIVQGAEPLFFLDYIGTSKLDPQWMAAIVQGVSDGCKQADCALLGGETAEMPSLYKAGEYDLAGFAVGVVELDRIIDGTRITEGDVILGLGSNGIHSNGFSLVHAILESADLDADAVYEELDAERSLGRVLLEPTRIYVRPIIRLLRSYRVKQVVTGMAHITGGGLAGNLDRPLPENVDAVVHRKAWDVPAVFRFLQKRGDVAAAEMDRVFNMGIGFCLIVRPTFADAIARKLTGFGERVYRLGEIQRGKGRVVLK